MMINRWCVLLLLALLALSPLSATSKLESSKKQSVHVAGDIILGGLFPMHERNISRPDRPCGAIKEEKGIQRMEAMLFALDEINADPKLLPNITLGAFILDTCSNPSYALEQSMHFVRSFMGDQDSEECSTADASKGKVKPVAGVIGAAFSGVSIMVANILRLFKIPQISYASTSTELSDKSRFEYFSRVVPPDNFQAQAMVEIAKAMGWSYVSTVAAEGEYGEKGIASFIALAKQAGICVAVSTKIGRNAQDKDFDNIVHQLRSKPKARAVVLFVDEDRTRKLLSATVRLGTTGFFYWIGSDSWGAKIHPVRHQEWAAEGAITILPKRSSLEGFDKYFLGLRPALRLSDCENYQQQQQGRQGGHAMRHHQRGGGINCRNPWFRQFWAHHFNCRFEDQEPSPETNLIEDEVTDWNSLRLCTGRERITRYEQEGLVPFVVDAMYAMAHALHKMVQDVCYHGPNNSVHAEHLLGMSPGATGRHKKAQRVNEGGHLCRELLPTPDGADLLKYIRNVSFISIQGESIGDVKFNSDGDRIGRYSIFQYQKVPKEGYKYVWVGEFGEYPELQYTMANSTIEITGKKMLQELALDTANMRWPNVSAENSPPKSVCSTPCPMGFVKSFVDACCWSCVRCREDSIVADEDKCEKCPLGYVPSLTKDQCLLLDAEPLDKSAPWSFFPILLASIGIFYTLCVVLVFILFNRTSIIMASGRELSYVLLGGILASYACTFVILAEPNEVNCVLLRLGLGICLCVCYSAIFTKTNRIYRIFHGCMKGNQKPAYISPKSQLVICSGLVSIQLTGVVIWLFIEPPSVQVLYPSSQTFSAIMACGVSTNSLAVSLGYNGLLIFLCTWYAFKTRKIPENFNEAKYIGFTMYSTCIIWLAFIPIFVVTRNDFEVQMSSLCMCVILSATVTLCCLFMPKLYIVLLHPEKYARAMPGDRSAGSTGGQGGQAAKSNASKMRFAKSRESSVSNLSDTARTPITPLTPKTPITPKIQQLNAQLENAANANGDSNQTSSGVLKKSCMSAGDQTNNGHQVNNPNTISVPQSQHRVSFSDSEHLNSKTDAEPSVIKVTTTTTTTKVDVARDEFSTSRESTTEESDHQRSINGGVGIGSDGNTDSVDAVSEEVQNNPSHGEDSVTEEEASSASKVPMFHEDGSIFEVENVGFGIQPTAKDDDSRDIRGV